MEVWIAIQNYCYLMIFDIYSQNLNDRQTFETSQKNLQ